MPTYSYICKECSKRTEIFQKITDPKIEVCPHCKKNSLIREIGGSMATFQFKGSGFYETDYKKSPRTDGGCKKCGNEKGSCKD